MESSVSPKLLLALMLLLAPVLQLQARELGGSQEQHVGGLPSVLVLPSGGGGVDGAVVVPPKLNKLPAGVSRPGGLVPPAPQPGKRPQPWHEPAPQPGKRPQPGHEPLQDVVSSPGVTGNNQKRAPPSPAGNPPSHYRRMGPASTDLLRVSWDAIVRVMWAAA